MAEMTDSDPPRGLSDETLLELRTGISRLTGALMRAWWLDMVVAQTPEEQRLFDEIRATVGEPAEQTQQGDWTPLAIGIEPCNDGVANWDDEGLTPISKDEYLKISGELVTRYKLLQEAYRRGMIKASNPAQERQLDELRTLLD